MPLLARPARALSLLASTLRLEAANRFSRSPVTGDAPCVVSVASYGPRLRTAHLALESVARGLDRPARLVLVLDEADLRAPLPSTLRRLQARGLEVRPGDSTIGPHNKWSWWGRGAQDVDLALVTADDDVMYPSWWLRVLAQATQAFRSDDVVCFRAKTVSVQDGRLTAYSSWPGCTSAEASPLHFATGHSGVAYPAAFRAALQQAGEGFRESCPKADDVWLHAVAVRSGHLVRQVSARTATFHHVLTSQGVSLMASNVVDGQNDPQIRATYSATDIAVLHDALTTTR